MSVLHDLFHVLVASVGTHHGFEGALTSLSTGLRCGAFFDTQLLLQNQEAR
ncbi:MAG: hypothetical protein KGH88_04645 [Thaumarchaeota archaeon]|nr:hypothetical protein [Nitrososphaerota archaeon]